MRSATSIVLLTCGLSMACAGSNSTIRPEAASVGDGAPLSLPRGIIEQIRAEVFASSAACEGGNAEACTRVLQHTVSGATAATRTAYGPAFEAGCEQGIPAACGGWGMAHIWQRGAPRHVNKGMSLLGRACDGGSADSCVLLAENLMPNNGYGIEADIERAITLLTQSCEQVGGSPCQSLAHAYANPGAHQDLAAVLEAFSKTGTEDATADPETTEPQEDKPRMPKKVEALVARGCATGSSRACYSQGNIARVNLKDEASARTYYIRACDNQLGLACHDLAWQHLGETIEGASQERAITLFARACALGDPAGCDFLSRTNEGTTLEPPQYNAEFESPEAHLEVMRTYCAYGGAESCFNVAHNLAATTGENDETAEEMVVALQSACNEGHVGGCNVLGHVSKDFMRVCERQLPEVRATLDAEAAAGKEDGEREDVARDSGSQDDQAWTPDNLMYATRHACAFTGFVYLYGVRMPRLNGRSVLQNRERALGALQQSCDAGSATVCKRLSELTRQ